MLYSFLVRFRGKFPAETSLCQGCTPLPAVHCQLLKLPFYFLQKPELNGMVRSEKLCHEIPAMNHFLFINLKY